MDGILVINKPCGMTSFDVIAKLRKNTNRKIRTYRNARSQRQRRARRAVRARDQSTSVP